MSGIELHESTRAECASSGALETPFFFGQGIFGVVHRPPDPGLPGWVLCSPFGSERTNSQRLYFKWAGYLAAAGHWVLRFDYRGTGDSVGAFGGHGVRDYVDDIARATNELERISGIPCRGVLGLRLGADLAAIFAANCERPLDLVMWEPIIDGRKYRDALLRTAMANEMVNAKGSHRTRDDFRRELAAGRSVSVDGFPVTPQIYGELETVDLPALGRPTSGSILVVQMKSGQNRPLKPAFAKLAETYSVEGEACLESVHEPQVWLKTKSFRWHLHDLFGITLGWIAKGSLPQPTELDPARSGSERKTNGHAGERPVGFDVEGERVWGILHEPAAPREEAPNIVMVSAGDACRAAFFYPRLARDLADRGWRVLRFDPRGIGDSHGDIGCDVLADVFARIESGALVPDIVAALDFMEGEFESRKNVLIGLCGGAITSVLTAQADDRVFGIAPLDFSLRLTQPAATHRQSKSTNGLPWHELLAQHRGTLFLLRVRRMFHLVKDRGRNLSLMIAKIFSSRAARVPGETAWFRERIGENGNFPVLAAVLTSLDRETPMCCVFADTEDARLFESLLPGFREGRSRADSLIRLHVIQGADHNFILPGCAEKLSTEILSWLDDPSVFRKQKHE